MRLRLYVKVRANAKEQKVEKIDESHFIASVKEPPTKDKANKALLEALSSYFNIPKSRINIISGHKSKNKIVEIKENAQRR
ncbi:MAG: DUF167 domain-containing protein [Candidatus Pacearchaeota archaeon]